MPRFLAKWKLVIKILPYLVLILALKYLVHFLGYEFLSLSSLFGALISANVFLIGFLITGVMSDFKEAEKLPSDIACSLEAIADECFIIYENKKSPAAKQGLEHISGIFTAILHWFQKETRTHEVMARIFELNHYFLKFEKETQANFIVRIKQEQNLLRKMIHRIHNIRELSFVQTGYVIVEAITFILILGLIVMKIDPYFESVFFVVFVSFFLLYMIVFLKDLDNPFGYYDDQSAVEEVSLKPISDGLNDLRERLAHLP